MLLTKMFEVRDRHTFIAVLATKLDPEDGANVPDPCDKAENWLLRRSGFRENAYLLLTRLDPVRSSYDPYEWDNTLREAHHYLLRNFDRLDSGAVIDVEFITGKSIAPKISEAFA